MRRVHMGFLKNAVKSGLSEGIGQGISKGINNAVGKVVETTVAPKAQKYADAAAKELDASAKAINDGLAEMNEGVKEVNAAASTLSEEEKAAGLSALGAVFSGKNLDAMKKNAEDLATQMASRIKICPECGKENDADRLFCSDCGAKLPEQTMAEGYVCPKCGKQNTIDTRFCAFCGEVLPAAKEQVEEERRAREEEKLRQEEEARRAAEAEAKRAADAEAAKAKMKEKTDIFKAGAREAKDKATELGGQAAEAALDAAGALFSKFKKKK